MAGHAPGVTTMLHPSIRFASLPTVLILLTLASATSIKAQYQLRGDDAREQAHQSPDWAMIEAHLVDPTTATVQRLIMQGDILRARRFPYDALAYYGYALKRESKNTDVINRIGVTHLELQNVVLARAYFQKAVKVDKKDAEAWNNLGATEYVDRRYADAISDYKRAVKLCSKYAIYHSNLAIAYFDQHDFNNGRKEMNTALKLDPEVFMLGSATGVAAHVLSSEDRARFSLEMAKVYAEAGNEAEMLQALEKAAEGGLDILVEMERDRDLTGYRKDPRVLVLVQNARALRSGRTVATADLPSPLPPLGAK